MELPMIPAIVALSLLSCVGEDEVSAHAKPERPPDAEYRHGAPRPPVRSLSLEAVDSAVKSSEELGDTHAAREGLGGIYQQSGYSGAALFFENIAREVKGEELVLAPGGELGGWGGGEREMSQLTGWPT
jgi:hypothetical protein